MKVLISAAVLSLLSISGAFAQSPAANTDDKKAISKACSDQANTQGLHGKDRKKFRAACIKTAAKT
jgi:hypothetical protein